MAAVSRLSLYGGPGSPYGSFSGKTIVVPQGPPVTRLGLYGGSEIKYGSFANKVTPPVVLTNDLIVASINIVPAVAARVKINF